MKVSVM